MLKFITIGLLTSKVKIIKKIKVYNKFAASEWSVFWRVVLISPLEGHGPPCSRLDDGIMRAGYVPTGGGTPDPLLRGVFCRFMCLGCQIG